MADLISTVHRQYRTAGSEKWRNTPIKFEKSKTDYSVFMGLEHPDHALNQEYLDAGAGRDHSRPLCVAVHNGVACRRPVTWKEGARYCGEGRGDG